MQFFVHVAVSCSIDLKEQQANFANNMTHAQSYDLYIKTGDLRIVGGMTITLSRRKGMPQST